MPDTRDLVQQVAQEIEASGTTSATPPGQNKDTSSGVSDAMVDAINQVFALFRLNYHNQYYAAFPDAEQLSQIKRLWLDSLSYYPVEQILKGAKHAIEHSEYLPTLNRMHDCCRVSLGEMGLPDARAAYFEACNAPTPKSAQRWSHPAVYLAGRDCDWFFLGNQNERASWPVFEAHYRRYCSLALQGESLSVPAPEALEKPTAKKMNTEEKLSQVQKLREETGL